MNIFYIDECPRTAAQMQCDKHVVKMIVESGQMLSTAHRLLDGVEYFDQTYNGRKIRRWRLEDMRENVLYKSVHMNHPCTIWTRENSANYLWHYDHFIALCDEYTYRYGKIHSTDTQLRVLLSLLPNNIPHSDEITTPALAMEESCKTNRDPIECYRRFYETKQNRFTMHWSKRHVPEWFHFYDETYVL